MDYEWNPELAQLSDKRDMLQVAKMAALKRALRKRYRERAMK